MAKHKVKRERPILGRRASVNRVAKELAKFLEERRPNPPYSSDSYYAKVTKKDWDGLRTLFDLIIECKFGREANPIELVLVDRNIHEHFKFHATHRRDKPSSRSDEDKFDPRKFQEYLRDALYNMSVAYEDTEKEIRFFMNHELERIGVAMPYIPPKTWRPREGQNGYYWVKVLPNGWKFVPASLKWEYPRSSSSTGKPKGKVMVLGQNKVIGIDDVRWGPEMTYVPHGE